MSLSTEDVTAERMKRDLQAGLVQFATSAGPTASTLLDGAALQRDLTDQKPTVRIAGLLNLLGNHSPVPVSPATIQRLALDDPDERVRGLALLRLLRCPSDIEDAGLRDFAEERGATADEVSEVLSIIRGANEDLRACRHALGRVAALAASLATRK